MNAEVLKEKVSTILTGLEGVRLVYLFGSRIEGSLGPMSDYDLGLMVDHGTDGRQTQARLAHALACALQTDRVDIVLLNRAPIELEGARKPVDYYDAILSPGELGVLPPDFARHLAPLASFRNILVHEYLIVDWDEVYGNLQRLEDLEHFAELVRHWLRQRRR